MKQKDKKMLKVAVLMSILSVYPYSVSFAEGVITTASPAPGIYDSIDRVVNNTNDEGFIVNSYNAGEFIITDGGSITVNKNASTAYGISADDSSMQATNINIGGKLIISIDNSKNTGTNEKTMGIWKCNGYNDYGHVGIITLNDTKLNVKGTYNAYGILAGSDFGNNSEGAGSIVCNSNLNIDVSTESKVSGAAGPANANRTFGIVTYDSGIVELNGEENTITVNGSGVGNNYTEISGIYTSAGGKINSSEKSNIIMNVSGNKVYGISTGYYDVVEPDKKGDSGVNLQGDTIVNLFGKTSTGIAVYQQATADVKNLTINFGETSKYNTGVRVADESTINIGSLFIGASGDSNYINDPTKITAISTENQWNWDTDESAGNVFVNEDGGGTVQIAGKVEAIDYGNVNINLNNNYSYIYGNMDFKNWDNKNGTIQLNISNSAIWTNVQDQYDDASGVTKLTLSNGGIVDLTDTVYTDINEHKYQNIYINDTFDGFGGTINMDIDASTNIDNSDRVYVDGTHIGTHYITLNNVGSNVDGAAGTVLVSVNNEQGEFKANDSEGTLYWNKYTLYRLDTEDEEEVTEGYNTDWILAEVEQTDEPATSVNTILGANALNYHTWIMESDKLMKRMGDLRHNGEDEQGAWFRVRGSKISRDDSAAFENKYTTYELGYDTLDKETEDYKRYAGASISYSDGTSSYERGSSENSGKAISFYSTTMRNKGHYLDFVFKVVDMDNDFSVFDTNGNNISGAMDNQGISVNVEYGRKKGLGDKWYIEPQGQLTFGYLGGDNYKLNNGIAVDQGGISSLVGRIGFNIGRDIDEKTNLYLKANLLHEFLGDYSLDMTDTATGDILRKDGSFGDTWGEIGIGAAIQTGKNNHIYFDVEKTFGGDFEKDWAWNAGMRWTF